MQTYTRLLELGRCRIQRLTVFALMALMLGLVPRVEALDAIRVASIFSHSGAAAGSNLPAISGVRWAIEEINRNGGVLGRQIQLIEIDNRGTPIGSKVAVDKAIRDQVTAIVGPAWSTHALAVARGAQAAGTPMITSTATHPEVTQVGDFIFRVCNSDLIQGRVLGQFARRELRAGRVVILQDISSDYSLGLARTFQESFEWFGGTVSDVLNYKASQTHFSSLLAAVAAAAPDVVFLPGHDESGSIIGEAHRMGLQVPFVGGDSWDVASFFAKGGDRLIKGYYATHWNEAVETPDSAAFIAKYKDLYPFLGPAALSYDAVSVLVDAMRRAGSTDRRAIRDALAATQNFQGITGKLAFTLDGDPNKPTVIMQIAYGQAAYLKQVHPLQLQAEAAALN